MRTLIVGGTVVTPFQEFPGSTVIVENGQIRAVVAQRPPAQPGDQIVDATGQIVAPGMIDVHVHGGAGYDTMDATQEALDGMARFFASHGVTSFLPTTMTGPADGIAAALEAVAACPICAAGAAHLGVHLEGPYLSPLHKGAQPETHLRAPDPGEYNAWFETGVARLITVAPEIDGALALIEAGVAHGVDFAVGHSDADLEIVTQAADRGLRQATHTFNAMKGLHHRTPGTLGAVLSDERIYAQLIADGIHVHPAMVKLLVRAKGTARTILITDAMRATGLPDGTYDLGGQDIRVVQGVARTAEGSLAGSTLVMDAAVRNVMAFAGLPLTEALSMATAVPAEALNLAGRKGVIAPGADADLILLDADLAVTLTMVSGQVVYRRS